MKFKRRNEVWLKTVLFMLFIYALYFLLYFDEFYSKYEKDCI